MKKSEIARIIHNCIGKDFLKSYNRLSRLLKVLSEQGYITYITYKKDDNGKMSNIKLTMLNKSEKSKITFEDSYERLIIEKEEIK